MSARARLVESYILRTLSRDWWERAGELPSSGSAGQVRRVLEACAAQLDNVIREWSRPDPDRGGDET